MCGNEGTILSVVARSPSVEGGRGNLPPVVARSAATKQSESMNKQYSVYIMTNVKNTVLYVGVTNDLVRRVFEHKSGFVPGFTSRYNLIKLVYYEVSESVESAIAREKQIKGGSRADKVALINGFNREWLDLYSKL